MYNANLVIDSRMAGVFRCKDCHMNFQSQHLLTKHKLKFCVGSTSDPDDLQLRRGLRSTSPRRVISPDDRPLTDSLLLNKKLYQLRKLKDQRSRSRDLQDLEERMLLDQLEDAEARGSPAKQRHKIPLSKHKDVRDLQLEYEKLREKENGIVRQNPRIISSRAGRQTPYSRNSNSSMSIHLDDEYRRNPNQDQQLRSLAENHGRQMEYLNLRNRDLEKQREDIRKQLENLGRRTVVPPQHDNTADLLRELREQEIRNQRALDDLKRQLHDLSGNQKVNVIEIEKPVYHQPPPPPPPPPEPPKRPLVFPIYHGKSLVSEIIAIRQAYLQNGGNDPDVLNNMAHMQAEAQAIEDQMNQKPQQRSPREKPKDNATTLNFLEMENDRLNQELRLLQEQNLLAQNRRKSDKEDELERELRRLQREHLEKMYGLQKELDDLRILLMMQRNQPQAPPQTVIQQAAQPPVSLKPYVEVEPMAPYDQYLNRFDKRQIATATRTWVATQHVKLQERQMFPIHEDEFKEEEPLQIENDNRLVPYDQPNQRTRPRFGTPALQYNPANERSPYLSQYIANQQSGNVTSSVVGQPGNARTRTLRSDTDEAAPLREAWGRPVEFD